MFHQEFGSMAILRKYLDGSNPLDQIVPGLTAWSAPDIMLWFMCGVLFGLAVYGLGCLYTARVVRLFGLPSLAGLPVYGSGLAAFAWAGMGAIVLGLMVLRADGALPMLVSLGVCGVLGVLALVDWRTGYLPDELTLPLLWAGLCWSWLGFGVPLVQTVGGIIVIWVFLVVVFRSYLWLRQQEGMGWGDLKLAAALGAWVGFPAVSGVLLVACFFGVALALMRTGFRGFESAFPFGPCLSLAGVLFLVALPT